MSKKCKAYSASKLGFALHDNRKAFYAGWDAAIAQHQPRKPLTDEEIINISKECRAVEGPSILWVTFARAIEAVHGIKENNT
jgi:hypothetical protein